MSRLGPPRLVRVLAVPALALVAACGGGAPTAGPAAPAPTSATDAEWRALATPRPAAIEGAAHVALGDFEVNGEVAWTLPRGVTPHLAVEELAAAGLLRRRDVRFVERRRFAEAAEAERQGRQRPPGAPAAGVAPRLDFLAMAVWSPLMGSGYLDIRLTDPATGAVVATGRTETPPDADATSLARAVVAGVLAALDEVGRRPAWTDPVAAAAPATYRAAGVPSAAVEAFLRGLAAEERWNWEGARVGYQAAVAQGGTGFVEAEAALARAARLRNGGTLGGS